MAIQFVDDPDGVPDSTVLFRRTSWEKIGGRRGEPGSSFWGVTPNFFTDAPIQEAIRLGFARTCMSVGVSTVLGDEPEKMLTRFPDMGLVAVTAGQLRSLQKGDGTPCPQGIMLAPTQEEPWHAVVFAVNEDKRSGAACKAIAKLCRVVVPLRS